MNGASGQNLIGAGGRLFGEVLPGADETSFQVNNTSSKYYASLYYLQHRDQLQDVPPVRVDPPRITLARITGDDFSNQIQTTRKIVFHAVGDTGAAKSSRS